MIFVEFECLLTIVMGTTLLEVVYGFVIMHVLGINIGTVGLFSISK
jgi:hypothetical protein